MKKDLTEFEQKVIDLVGQLESSQTREFFRSEVQEAAPDDWCTESFYSEGISIELVESEGGEDQGIVYFSVYKFSKGTDTAFVKFDGWYSSYEGAEFDEAFIVRPEQVLVTVYN